MALKPCRECKKMVSNEAVSCPHCGVPTPRWSSRAEESKPNLWPAFILMLLVAICIYACELKKSGNSDQDAGEKKSAIDTRTGRPLIDFGKPLWVIAGSAVCPDNKEIEAARRRAPNQCIRLEVDQPVTEMEMSGFLMPAYRVRFKGTGIADDFWVGVEGLRN